MERSWWSQTSSVSPDILSLTLDEGLSNAREYFYLRLDNFYTSIFSILCPINVHFPGDFICLFMIISETFIALPLWSDEALDLD